MRTDGYGKMNAKIRLSGKDFLVKGKKRLVYRHPSKPDLLIKVFRKKASKKTIKEGIFGKQYRRFAFLSGFTREIREFVYSRYEEDDPLVGYIADIIGFADTGMGMGIIVSAAVDKNGNLAPTLSSLIKQKKISAERINLLEELFDRINASKLVIGDLTARNIVMAYIPGAGERFLLIDGLGDKTFVPIQRWFSCINRRNKTRRINKLRKRVNRTVISSKE